MTKEEPLVVSFKIREGCCALCRKWKPLLTVKLIVNGKDKQGGVCNVCLRGALAELTRKTHKGEKGKRVKS